MNKPVEISILIPAYNEEKRLVATLESLQTFVSTHDYFRTKGLEVLVANDGSTDQTRDVVRAFQDKWAPLFLIDYLPNRGKGYAVRRLLLQAQGKFLVFNDADMAISWDTMPAFLQELEAKETLAGLIGSKGLSTSESNIPLWHPRRLMGRLFNFLVKFLTGLNFSDTQCGFKVFRRALVTPLIPLLKVDRFAWDVEFLIFAQRRGLVIEERAVSWRLESKSRVRILHDSLDMLWNLCKLRIRLLKRTS
jgi:dolichyl-phosphate beta-glucosyltransferase